MITTKETAKERNQSIPIQKNHQKAKEDSTREREQWTTKQTKNNEQTGKSKPLYNNNYFKQNYSKTQGGLMDKTRPNSMLCTRKWL